MLHLNKITEQNVRNLSPPMKSVVRVPEGNIDRVIVAQAGRCARIAMTLDYPSLPPWVFIGGKIYEIIVDSSGESYINLELET